jgi:hypothetical protein
MSNPNNQIGIYIDSLIAETLLGDGAMLKTAQNQNIMSSIVGKVKDYFSSKVDPNDKAGSILNMLAPGIIRTTFAAIGMPWLGLFLGIADSFFHIDVASILRSIWTQLKEVLSGNKPVTSEQIHNIVQSSVNDHVGPATEQEADTAAQQADQSGQNPADDGFTTQIRTAQLMRLAMEDHFINKEAASRSWFSSFSTRKSATGNLLSSLLSLLFRVALSSAGLLVAGDVMNKFLNRPNSLDGSIQQGKPTGETNTPSASVPSSGRPTNPGYQDIVKNSPNMSWVENITNNQSDIQQMLLNFAKDVYPISGQESAIESSPKFQNLVETIVWYNHESPGGPVVFIPRMFPTKKQLVDLFITDIPETTPINR